MKELSIEQKAKRFDEVLAMAKECITYVPDDAVKKYMLNMFPELAESEDERIRRWIIDDIRFNMNNEPLNNSEYRKKAEKAIAWLEKQGKKPVEEYNITGITSGYAKGKLAKIIKDIESEDKIEALQTEYEKGRADAISEMQVAWSEDDKARLQRIIDFLWYNRKGDTDTIYQQEQDIDWLKSLKQRIGE